MADTKERDFLPTLYPPGRFGIVENGVYRSSPLLPLNLPFIKTLKLKTVIRLSPEVPNKTITAWYEENNIKLIHLGLKTLEKKSNSESNNLLTEEIIKEALEIILDVTYHPVLLLCNSGVHHTGIVVACLRKLQDHNLTYILQEYSDHANSNTRFVNEQFIELFDADLVTLPQEERLPKWFIESKRMYEEEKEEEQQQQGGS